MYHAVDLEMDKYRVVRATVEPYSIMHGFEELDHHLEGGNSNNYVTNDMQSFLPKLVNITNPIESCKSKNTRLRVHTNFNMLSVGQLAEGHVLFTYDVIWIENQDLYWSSRWDVYLHMDHAIPDIVHWLSLANSA
eukprot:scaffold29051_cov94-Attheya_sp.AAC.1